MFTLALCLSLAGLLLGALLVASGRGRSRLAPALDGLTLGLVPALVLLRFLPHLHEGLGWAALPLVAAGFAGVMLAERRRERDGVQLGRALVVPTLTLHSLLDGASLALAFGSGAGGATATMLASAIVVHRVPEGLLVASVDGSRDPRRLLLRLAPLAAATLGGALAGRVLLTHATEAALHGVVAVGLGVVLRVALHRHAAPAPARAGRALGALGFLAGAALVLLVPSPDDVLRQAQPRELSLLQSIGPLFVETAPSMLLGLLGAGLIHAFAPRRVDSFLRGGGSLSQAARGVLFGLPLPMCTCGVQPLLRRLLAGGIPAAAAVAFAIATPELDVGGAALSVRLFGVRFTVLRIGASLVAAVLVAVAVGAASASTPPGSTDAHAPPTVAAPRKSFAARLRAAIDEALGPSLDHLAAFYVVGLLLAAVVEAALAPELLARVGAPLDVFVGAVAAIPAYVCAQGTAPLAAVLVHKGLSVGAALALLMVGPATNLGVLGILRRALGGKAALTFAAGNIAVAVAAGLAANVLVPRAGLPEVHALVAHEHIRFEWIAALVLAALLLRSLFRLGPRGWFAMMLDAGHDHAGATCDHRGCHTHAPAHAGAIRVVARVPARDAAQTTAPRRAALAKRRRAR
jgi:hypothetical protein